MKHSHLNFSIIIPVYNRPQEIDELLNSITKLNFEDDFEIIIVEDGSENNCDTIIETYETQLNINYYQTKNNGAGASRNFGMQNATGNYFIILDSDVLLPKNYLSEVKKGLSHKYTDAFGGPDKAHKSFTPLQKAINYSMTSLLTTGGIRGNKAAKNTFQPRSFNMGISKEAYEKTGGFSVQKIGEDIDLTFRIWKLGFKTQLIEDAFVYHKRRTSLQQFFKQTFAFGSQRPKLNKKYPGTAKLTYWFPTLFSLSLVFSIFCLYFGFSLFMLFFFFYFVSILFHSFYLSISFRVSVLAVVTTLVQFFGYGLGFLKSTIKF